MLKRDEEGLHGQQLLLNEIRQALGGEASEKLTKQIIKIKI